MTVRPRRDHPRRGLTALLTHMAHQLVVILDVVGGGEYMDDGAGDIFGWAMWRRSGFERE